MTTLLADIEPQVANIDDSLGVLSNALRGCGKTTRSVEAAAGTPSPSEGLALVSAYLRIEDEAVRQAVLDTVSALAGHERS